MQFTIQFRILIIIVISLTNRGDCQLKPKVVKIKALEEIKKHVGKAEFDAILHPERFEKGGEEHTLWKQNISVLLAKSIASFTTKPPRKQSRKRHKLNSTLIPGSRQSHTRGPGKDNETLLRYSENSDLPVSEKEDRRMRKLKTVQELRIKKENEEIARRIREKYGGRREPIDMTLVERYRMRKKLEKFVHSPFHQGNVTVFNESYFGVLEVGMGRSVGSRFPLAFGRALNNATGPDAGAAAPLAERPEQDEVPVREWGDECVPVEDEDLVDECFKYTLKLYGEQNNAKLLDCDFSERTCLCLRDDKGRRAEYSFNLKMCLLPKYYRCTQSSQCEPLLICEKARERDYQIEPRIHPGYPKICRLKLNYTQNYGAELGARNSRGWISLHVVVSYVVGGWLVFLDEQVL